MEENDWLAEQFEQQRPRLRGVAYRMLGSLSEAEDAVQQGWLKLSRSDAGSINNLAAWLTTVVARVCLDMMRSRESRREESLDAQAFTSTHNPEEEAVLADSVGLALLVVLDTLEPAERLAFVLHDMFGMSFDEIARIVDRSPAAARQLASRARRRVQGAPAVPDVARQREVVDAYLAAARGGDLSALLAVLDPNVVVRANGMQQAGGAMAVAERAIKAGARAARPALVDGEVGIVIAPRGRLLMVLRLKIADGRIAEIDMITNRERLNQLDLGLLSE
jgi:RNA polymerase sigma factor (sigma-70 family)